MQKEKGLPHANENSPRTDDKSMSFTIIPQKDREIKSNLLRELRTSKCIPAKDIVEIVRNLYPKYDKTLQSKCERGSEYGVELRKDAMDVLLEKYAPEQLIAEERKRDGHRLTCRISCRLENNEYAQLIKFTKEDGFDQMQAWLTFIVRKYLKSKVKKVREKNEYGK